MDVQFMKSDQKSAGISNLAVSMRKNSVIVQSKELHMPTKTIVVYKLFATKKSRPGLYPLFIDKGNAVPMGKWIDAEFIPTKGYAHRPGWHAGIQPCAPHLMSKEGKMLEGRVWTRCRMSADVDWQPMADQSPTRDIRDRVPVGGFYKFPRPFNQGGEWLIGGSLLVEGVMSDSEVAEILENGGMYGSWYNGEIQG